MSKKIHRAYAILNITKSVDASGDEERVIEGIATTPSADRYGDIVDPMGAMFQTPMPLLWQHNHDEPVGLVEFAKPTKSGIPFRARLPKILEEGKLKDRIDEAWQSVKAGLVRAVSIGFSAKDYEVLPSGGLRFKEWEWLELSLVTIPANAEATIQTIKKFDSEARTTAKTRTVKFANVAGDTAKTKTQFSTQPATIEDNDMTLKEQLEALRQKRAQAAARMQELINKSAEVGETLDETQGEEFDGLEADIAAIDLQIKRVEAAEKLAVTTAAPVGAPANREKAAAARGTSTVNTVQLRGKEEKGILFAKYARCYAKANGNLLMAERIAENEYRDDPRVLNIVRAAVAAGSTSDPTWIGNLVGEERSAFADFAEFLRPQTIVGRFGQGNIPSLRRVPFKVPLIGQTSGGSAGWVGEGKGKPLTKFDYSRATLDPTKVAAIAVLTKEALKYSNPSADTLVRDSLVDAVRERIDVSFIDPSFAGTPGTSPASITYGAPSVPSSGTTADAVRADIRALLATFIAAQNAPSTAVLIMSSLTALSLGMMVNTDGSQAFPGLSIGVGSEGGSLLGIPVLVSDYVPTDTSGSIVVLVNASDIWLGDEDGFQIDMSGETSLQMDDAPTQSSVATVTGTTMVSMFQTNSIAIRAEREISWAKRRASAVAYLTGVFWGAPTAP